MTHLNEIPNLPETIEFETSSIDTTVTLPTPDIPIARPPFQVKSLKHGCYLLQWQPSNGSTRFNGTMRVERHDGGTTASGDLYQHSPFKVIAFPSFRFVPNPDPSPSAGIPIFTRGNYRYYLRVTKILENTTLVNSFTMRFERHLFDSSNNTWTNEGVFSAKMIFKPTPSHYSSGATFLEGDLISPSGTGVGKITMGWVSKYLRKATLEIDRVAASESPDDNGSGIDWSDVFKPVGWDVNVIKSDADLSEPSGQSWSNAEMHAAMLDNRDSHNLDSEWRYYLICVRKLDSTSRGIMFDAFGGDSNNIPREGAGISSHWTIPNDDPWGTVKGQRFGAADAPYFRTAVHELGHALGLYHNTADNGFMNTTGTIADNPGVFPSNIQWSFNSPDAKRLRHMPDPWVRPGMIPFGQAYNTIPISPTDMMDMQGAFALKVESLLPQTPIGAPVRVKVTLTNRSDVALEVPDGIALKSEHVIGRVRDPAGTARTFQSVFRCVEDHSHRILKPGQSMSDDLTLLRGNDGALFPSSGLHVVEVDVVWEMDSMPVSVSAKTAVMITPAIDDSHAQAAIKTLTTPDLLLTLAIGGDHITEGKEALETAMQDKILAPHYAVTTAKNVGRRFGKRKADITAALLACSHKAVMSTSEARSIATIAKDLDVETLKKVAKQLATTLKSAADDDKIVADIVKKIIG